MKEKKDLYAEEFNKLEVEDLESVSGGGDYISERLEGEDLQEYSRMRRMHVQAVEDYIDQRITKAEYDAICKQFKEYKKSLYIKYGWNN